MIIVVHIKYHICNHPLFIPGSASFQHSGTVLSKKPHPAPRASALRCITRPCEDKPNIILCENRAFGSAKQRKREGADAPSDANRRDQWFVSRNDWGKKS